MSTPSSPVGLLPPKAHRRVKSLVREFDGQPETKPVVQSPPLSPDKATIPKAPVAKPSGHTRRSASVSYSSSASASTSGSFNYGPAPGIAPTKSFPAFEQNKVSAVSSTGAHQRRRSSNNLSGIMIPEVQSNMRAEQGGLDGLIEEEEGDFEKDDQEDVFLPLSPTSPAPFVPRYTMTSPVSNRSSPVAQAFPRPTGGEHARKHSKIHERNLSAFFPRPGGEQGVGFGDTYADPTLVNRKPTVSEIPPAVDTRISSPPIDDRRGARRGHHHKHSVSHQFSSILNPADPSSMNSPYSPMSPTRVDSFAHSHPLSAPASRKTFVEPALPFRSSYSNLPSPIRFVLFAALHLPLGTQLALVLSMAQIVLGAALWITGQSEESLSVTGLGYLVVFDGIGGLSGVLVEGAKGVDRLWASMAGTKGDAEIRLPFGNQRFITLSHFSQAIYLLFSAVYVCKESVEHVLMLHGPLEADGSHGAGHGGMGHGEGLASVSSVGSDGIVLPVALLALSAFLTLVSAVVLRNHQSLSESVGATGLNLSGKSKSGRKSALELLTNPFTMTVLVFSGGLAVSAMTIPGPQLAPLDKVVALLQSVAMFYVAYPAAVATGQVLLQTAPPSTSAQMGTISSGLRDVENHPLVVSIARPHIWQLTPSPHSPPSSSSSDPYGRRSTTDSAGSSLVATLQIKVKHDASDEQILQITKFARERCAPGMKWGTISQSSTAGGGVETGGLGDLTVSVTRSKEKASNVNFYGSGATLEKSHSHSAHDHSNGHGHHH